jgi:probable phosphoglycerate mutase
VAEIGARADRLIARLRSATDDVILFAHGHILRVLTARWLELPPGDARHFLLGTAAVCILAYEHNKLDEPAVSLWNDTSHVQP